MATIKKNALANIVFPMVDGTDFASLESGITASDFNSAATKKFFGVNHGVSNVYTSGTLSHPTLLVRSGIFHQELKASETNYDYIVYQFLHPSCADQLLIFQPATYNDSDMYSYLSDIGSNIVSMVSDLISLTSDIDSQLIVNFSLLSDVDDNVSVLLSNVSDVESQVNVNASMLDGLVAGQYSDTAALSNIISLISDVESQVDVNYDLISDVRSALEAGVSVSASDMSDIASRVGVVIETTIIPLGASNISDVASRVWADTIGTRVDSRILVLQSSVSDVDSQLQLVATSDYLSAVHSDIVSAIGNVSVTLTASDISDIASAVAVAVGSDISDVYSLVQNVDSQLLLNASMVSDTQSALDSQFVWTSAFLSDMNSDLASQIGGITASVDASDMSDIASRVWATTEGTRVDSRVLVIQSNVSDVESQVDLNASVISDVQSALDSQFVWTSNTLSDLQSDLSSQLTVNYDLISDVESQLDLTASVVSDIDSQITLDTSTLSNIHSLVTNVDSQLLLNASSISNIDSQLDVTHSLLSDVESSVDAIWTTQLTEAYNADGVAPTAAQALFGILQNLTEFSINATTITVKKLDGATSAMTFTLDDNTNPTSRTRAT